MKRREILFAASTVTLTLSGCMGDINSGNTETEGRSTGTKTEQSDIETEERDIEYEQCSPPVIPIEMLPEPAKEEANAAIEDGVYETDGELVLSEVMNFDDSYIYASTYYNMSVSNEDGVTRLYSEETLPKIDSPGSLQNQMDIDATVTLRLRHEGKSILEETFDIAAGDTVILDDEAEYRYGSYTARLTISTTNDTRRDAVSWEYGYTKKDAQIGISADSITISQLRVEPPVCEWHDNGTLKDG